MWIPDHLQFGSDPTNEGWTLLTFLAAAFPRFRYGHLVLSHSFRNPALLAKMASTLQNLSGGRLILGIGEGWHEEEYRSYNFNYPSGGTRVAQMAGVIQIRSNPPTSTPSIQARRFPSWARPLPTSSARSRRWWMLA